MTNSANPTLIVNLWLKVIKKKYNADKLLDQTWPLKTNISSSLLDVSSPHLFGMSRVLRVPVQNRAGNIRRAVTSVLPCQPGVITGLTMIGSVSAGIFSWAARVGRDWLSLDRRSSGAGGWGGRCLLLSVCVLWTFAPLCYIYVPMDSVNPSLTCKADLYWEGTLCCWLMFGDTFTAAAVNSAQLRHQIVFCDFNLDFVTTVRCNYRWGSEDPNLKTSTLKINFFLHFVTKQTLNWQTSKIAEHFKPTFASWALTQLVKVFFWICSCSTVEAERDRNTLKWRGGHNAYFNAYFTQHVLSR